MSRSDQLTRLRAGLEAKHFGGGDTPQWKLDRIWDWAELSMSEAYGTWSEELDGIKRAYAELAELVTR